MKILLVGGVLMLTAGLAGVRAQDIETWRQSFPHEGQTYTVTIFETGVGDYLTIAKNDSPFSFKYNLDNDLGSGFRFCGASMHVFEGQPFLAVEYLAGTSGGLLNRERTDFYLFSMEQPRLLIKRPLRERLYGVRMAEGRQEPVDEFYEWDFQFFERQKQFVFADKRNGLSQAYLYSEGDFIEEQIRRF